MKTKKILFTTSHPAPYWDIIYKEVSQTFDIIVYYNRSKDADKAWKKQNNIKGEIVSETTFFKRLKDIYACDFAVLGGWGQKSNLVFMFMLIVLKKPFAFFSDVPDSKEITPKKKILKKILLSFVPYLYVTGTTCKEHYKKYYGIEEKKLVIFPYGVNFPSIKEVLHNREIRKINLKKSNKINIFIANRFLERKGYKTLFKAFEILQQKALLKNFSIVIAGKGVEFEFYESKINTLNENIRLVGWVEMDEYEAFLKESDIYIHSSYFEPYGIPVIDAMANGKVVIASDGVMSAIDNITNKVNGYIYTKYDAEIISEILEELLDNKNLITSISKETLSIHDTFRTNYSQTILDSMEV